jgi:hypothetical protein
MTKLHLAHDLTLPPDIATAVTLIAGKRGSGKTNTAKRLVEQLHAAHVPFGVLDPVDVWWGLKAGKDGGREGGLPIYVFGGKHADYPLAPTGGGLMADLFVDYRISAVMALREWSGGERARFVKDFASRLLERNTEPFTVVAEEAHDLMPQSPMGDEKGSLGAMLRMVKLGRSGGIGLVELTQRLAALNKTATTQADVLVIHRTTGPQDRKALNDWINEHHAGDEEKNAFLRALPELKTGEAFVWAPDFPEDKPLGLKRVKILPCETFNSHATPKVGEKRVEPKELTPVDLARLSKAMSATVEKAKHDDPREKDKIIATLRKELAGAQKAAPLPEVVTEIVEKAVLKDGQLDRAERMVAALNTVPQKISELLHELAPITSEISSALSAVSSSVAPKPLGRASDHGSSELRRDGAAGGTAVRAGVRAPLNGAGRSEQGSGTSVGVHTDRPARAGVLRIADPSTLARTTDGISGPQQRMLDALAWLDSVGAPGARWSVLAFLAGQKPKSSGFEKNVSTLRSSGHLIGNGKNIGFELSDQGHAIANAPAAPATSEELHRAIFAKISTPQERMLRALIDTYPRNLTWDELAAKGEQSPNSSGFEKNVSTLKSYGLIEGQRNYGYVALGHLFLDGVPA